MGHKRVLSDEFEKGFSGDVILTEQIEGKLHQKHHVYSDDICDGLSDPYKIVLRSNRKTTQSLDKRGSSGELYEILCETTFSKILFVVCRLFPDGNLYIITAYWANEKLTSFYHKESEVLRDE